MKKHYRPWLILLVCLGSLIFLAALVFVELFTFRFIKRISDTVNNIVKNANIQMIPNCEYPVLEYGNEGDDCSLLVINDKDGKFGFIDTSGNIVIEPMYLGAHPFSEGLAAVKQGYFWGYIDKQGNTVIDFKYDEAGQFRKGHAAVSIRKSVDGKPVYKGPYDGTKWGLIDTEGREIFPVENFSIQVLTDGTVIRQDGLFYSPDLSQETHLPEGATICSNFQEGMATAYIYPDNAFECMYGYVNEKGAWVLPPQFLDAGNFSEGLAGVQFSDGSWGYIDKTGKTVIQLDKSGSAVLGEFGEGLAYILTESQRGFIDRTGEMVHTIPRLEDGLPESFSDRLCKVFDRDARGNEYCWFIGRDFKKAFDSPPDVTAFKDGIAQVLVDGKIGYIDKTGKYIWEPR